MKRKIIVSVLVMSVIITGCAQTGIDKTSGYALPTPSVQLAEDVSAQTGINKTSGYALQSQHEQRIKQLEKQLAKEQRLRQEESNRVIHKERKELRKLFDDNDNVDSYSRY